MNVLSCPLIGHSCGGKYTLITQIFIESATRKAYIISSRNRNEFNIVYRKANTRTLSILDDQGSPIYSFGTLGDEEQSSSTGVD